MSKSVMHFIAVVAVHFPAPVKAGDETGERAWYASMIKVLDGYAPEVLAKAAETIVRTRTPKDGRFFPLPSECAEACEEAKRLVAPPTLALAAPASDLYSKERKKLADELLVGTELGRRAAREGWHTHLWHHIRETMRMPGTDAEIAALKAEARAFDETMDKLRRAVDADCQSHGPLIGTFLNWGRHFVSDREKLRRRVIDGETA